MILREEPPERCDITQTLIEAINKAQKNILIIQPYVTPIEEIETPLLEAHKRNVDIQVITSRKRD